MCCPPLNNCGVLFSVSLRGKRGRGSKSSVQLSAIKFLEQSKLPGLVWMTYSWAGGGWKKVYNTAANFCCLWCHCCLHYMIMCYRNLLIFQRWRFPRWPCFVSPSQWSRNLELPLVCLDRAFAGNRGLVRGLQQPNQGWREEGPEDLTEVWIRPWSALVPLPILVTDRVAGLCWGWKDECSLVWVAGSPWIIYLLLWIGCQNCVGNHQILSIRLRLKISLPILIDNI